MKVIIECILLVLVVLYIGRTEISFSPFCLRMEGWQNVVGFLLLLIGLAFIASDFKQRTYYEGFEDGVDYTIIQFKERLNREEEAK